MEEVLPSVDIFEEGDDVVVKAELPGIKKEDIDVSITDHTIRISGGGISWTITFIIIGIAIGFYNVWYTFIKRSQK